MTKSIENLNSYRYDLTVTIEKLEVPTTARAQKLPVTPLDSSSKLDVWCSVSDQKNYKYDVQVLLKKCARPFEASAEH
jgi:hypothetical protein